MSPPVRTSTPRTGWAENRLGRCGPAGSWKAYPEPVTSETSETLRDTSRVSPPARTVVLAEVTENPIDPVVHCAAVAGAVSGAVVSFSGVVRNHDGGRPVT